MDRCKLCDAENIDLQYSTPEQGLSWVCPVCKDVLIDFFFIERELPIEKSKRWLLSAFFRRQKRLDLPATKIGPENISNIMKTSKDQVLFGMLKIDSFCTWETNLIYWDHGFIMIMILILIL